MAIDTAGSPPAQVLRHESELGGWEMVRRPPPPALAGLVDGTYCGWTETFSPGPIRRELPTTQVPLIFNFGAGYRIGPPGGAIERGEVHGSFVAGLYQSFAETQATGPTRGLPRCFGATPKRLARIVRFSRFAEGLRRASRVDWAAMALASGYYDQAHLIRDCRAFAGCTPRGLLARRLPGGGGWLGGADPALPTAVARG